MKPLDLQGSIANALKLARDAAPAAVLASGLLGPAALGAPGDLDPSFGDVGRAYPLLDLDGPAWSIQAQGDDDFIVAGGDYYDSFYYDTFVSGFAHRLSGDGSIDQTFTALRLSDTEVIDVAVQADGKVIGVGRTLQGTPQHFVLTVFRLDFDGALDPSFGNGGIVHMGTGEPDLGGTSVDLDPDGRIVVAGLQGTWAGPLIVARFLANGTLDAGFGVDGVYTGPVIEAGIARPRILGTDDGQYRITINTQGTVDPGIPVLDCRVLGLTSGGAIDTTFGNAGYADVDDGFLPNMACSALAGQPDGALLVAGSNADHGMVVRLVASGAKDESFSAPAIAAGMAAVTALGVGGDGSILVAGQGSSGVPGPMVARLQAGGQLDALFGNGGSTLIDLPAEYETSPSIHAMTLKGNRVLVAGGDGAYWPHRPFVAQLLADDSTDGPGVLSIVPPFFRDAQDQDGETVVTVRRTGGRAGRLSVLLQTLSPTGSPFGHAIAAAGEDYVTTTRTLTWEDGEVGDQQVAIPILPDVPDSVPDEYEVFEVALSDVDGAAGLGLSTTRIAIAADGEPAGQFSIETFQSQNVVESQGSVETLVFRNYYYDGAVSVTVNPVAGTATAGDDYAGDPVTLTWADGEGGYKSANVAILNDAITEEAEQFSMQLSTPTGGAVVGPRSTVTFTILRNDQTAPPPPPPNNRSSGGGSVGLLSTLLLGLAGCRRLRLRGKRFGHDGALARLEREMFQRAANRGRRHDA